MKIAIFVHDLTKTIGHSRALIETINSLPAGFIQEIKVISYTADPLDEIFDKHNCEKKHVSLPFKNLYPALLKIMFYHLYTYFYVNFSLAKEFTKIGIGIAALNVDIVNVQFVHRQWERPYFKIIKLSPLKWPYKRLLFLYFRICEDYFFRRKDLKVMALSQFVLDFLRDHYKMSEKNSVLAYSGVNTSEFLYSGRDKAVTFEELKEDYPQLQELNLDAPIYLFVGAFERKGLPRVISILNEVPDSQLIVVGQPEGGSSFQFNSKQNLVWVKHTKKIRLFYELADAFVFPTIYEPFGLVLIEAAASGLSVYSTYKEVGAMEILNSWPGVFNIDDVGVEGLKNISILKPDDRMAICQERSSKLSEYTWENTAKSMLQLLN